MYIIEDTTHSTAREELIKKESFIDGNIQLVSDSTYYILSRYIDTGLHLSFSVCNIQSSKMLSEMVPTFLQERMMVPTFLQENMKVPTLQENVKVPAYLQENMKVPTFLQENVKVPAFVKEKIIVVPTFLQEKIIGNISYIKSQIVGNILGRLK